LSNDYQTTAVTRYLRKPCLVSACA